jgi:hypothetical protein
MQRGILPLTKLESTLAKQLSQDSTQDLSSLISKLQLAINGTEGTSNIEVNGEEVEALLDAMSIPSDNEDPRYKVLRNKLLMFLAKKNE